MGEKENMHAYQCYTSISFITFLLPTTPCSNGLVFAPSPMLYHETESTYAGTFYNRNLRRGPSFSYKHSCLEVTTIISWVRRDKVWSPCFNVKMVLLSRATGSVSSGNLSAFDVISSKARKTDYYYWPRSFVSFQNSAGFHGRWRAAADIVSIGNQASCPWQQCSFTVKTW